MSIKCVGCGQTIQSIDQASPGYAPVSATVHRGDSLYCQRCYGVIHHNVDYSSADEEGKKTVDYYEKIKHIKEEEALVILVLDVMDIHGGFVPNLSLHIGKNPVIILVNKADLFPKSVVLNRLKSKIRNIGLSHSLNIKDVLFISARLQQNVEEAFKKIISYFSTYGVRGRFCYVIGTTSVGKSSFINTIMRNHQPETKPITTSSQHQTTIELIKIALGKNKYKQMCYLIDTPGYFNKKNITANLAVRSLQILNPTTIMRVRSFQLREPQVILLGGLAKITFHPDEGKHLNVAFYVSNSLYIHRTKVEKADVVVEKHRFDLIVPPFTKEEKEKLGSTKEYHYQYQLITGTVDICIAGLGYLHMAKPCGKITIETFKNVLVTEAKDFL